MSKAILIHALWVTAGIEALCLVLRYGMSLKSSETTAGTIGWITGGIRVHHGYVGLIMLIVIAVLPHWRGGLRDWLIILAIALFASDIIHHFGVLWIVEGDPHFDLMYSDDQP